MAADLGAKLRTHMQAQIAAALEVNNDALPALVLGCIKKDSEIQSGINDTVNEAVDTVLANADDYNSFTRAVERVVENYIDANIDLEDLVKDALDNYFNNKSFAITPEN